MRTGVDDFWVLLKEVTRTAAWVLPTAGISPVIAALVGLNPPWPQRVPMTVATSAAVLVTLVAVFQFLSGRKKRPVNRWMLVSLTTGVLVTAIYFVLFALLVYRTPVTHESFAKGFECTPLALEQFGSKCPWLDMAELKSAEYEAAALWTLPSIVAARVSLLFSWFAMFILFSFYLGSFLRHQLLQRGEARKTPA